MINIIPSIQLLGNKIVSFPEGNIKEMKTFDIDLIDFSLQAKQAGISRLCIIDISGARSNAPQSLDIVHKVVQLSGLKVTIGGGIKSREALKNALACGADHIMSASIAVLQPNVFNYWCECFEPSNIIFAADIMPDGLAIKGWKETHQTNAKDAIGLAVAEGLKKVVVRDVCKEGTLSSPNIKILQELISAFPKLEFAARGGISSIDDINSLEQIGVSAAFIGTAILENRLTFTQIKEYYSPKNNEQEN